MTTFLKYLLLCLTVVTVGAAQVAGAQASFFCGCTGKTTLAEACGVSCHGELPGSPGTCPGEGSAPHHDPAVPAGPDHPHREVVVELIATTAPASFFAQVVVWQAVLTDPFPSSFPGAPSAAWPACWRPPPEALVLKESVRLPRTIVMLV